MSKKTDKQEKKAKEFIMAVQALGTRYGFSIRATTFNDSLYEESSKLVTIKIVEKNEEDDAKFRLAKFTMEDSNDTN